MSKRVILSIILIVLAVGAMLVERGVVGGLIGSFFIVMMLFLWAIPNYPTDDSTQNKGPVWKKLALAFLGIGLGLFAFIAAAWVLPPQVFPWVIMAAGIGLIIWFFISRR